MAMDRIQYCPIQQNDVNQTVLLVEVLRTERRRRQILSIITGLQSLIILVGVWVFCLPRGPQPSLLRDSRRGFPPAESSLRFESRLFLKYGFRDSATAQEPGPELDAAWHSLLSGMIFKVSEEEVQGVAPDASSVALADGTGLIASLGVHHELHCVKLLKHWLHREHYLAGWDDARVFEYWTHLNHCLDWLKEAALCHGDTTLTTYVWNGTSLQSEYPAAYRCVQPASLFGWVRARAVDVEAPGMLAGPGV